MLLALSTPEYYVCVERQAYRLSSAWMMYSTENAANDDGKAFEFSGWEGGRSPEVVEIFALQIYVYDL